MNIFVDLANQDDNIELSDTVKESETKETPQWLDVTKQGIVQYIPPM